VLLDTAPGPDRQQALDVYQRLLQQEIDLLDQIVAGCYASFRQFDLFASFSMIYFAAAVFSEDQRRRGNSGIFDAHLLAGNDAYRHVVNAGLDALQRQLARSRPADTAELEAFRAEIAGLIAPFNLAGFCDPARQHMYPYI
jgi:FADH2 O2-dependent halogenase